MDHVPPGSPRHQVVQREERDDGGTFFIDADGVRAAELVYSRSGPGTITIEHTEVGEALRGQGAGKRLVEEAVRWARVEKLRVVAVCPFARATFDKHPDLQDVLAR